MLNPPVTADCTYFGLAVLLFIRSRGSTETGAEESRERLIEGRRIITTTS